MAMKALICPQCGAELEMDDSRDFGFCTSCGAKIMLHETVEMKHTGFVSMKIDNSEQGNNRILLGSRAFEGKNYEEAYRYYTQSLEDIPDSFTSLYRKGICAVYLSPGDSIRIQELTTGINAAMDVLKRMFKNAAGNEEILSKRRALTEQFNGDIEKLVRSTLKNTQDYFAKCKDMAAAQYQAACWRETAGLLCASSLAVPDDALQEELLSASIERCDMWLRLDKQRKVSYYVNTTTNEKGKSTDNYNVYRMPEASRRSIEDARRKMADAYNNMDSRKEREKAYRSDIDSLNREKSELENIKNAADAQFRAAKNEFWEANPDLVARRRKIKGLSWISVAVGVLILLIAVLFRKKLGMIAVAAAAVIFIVSFLAKVKISARALAKLEEQVFPTELKALGTSLKNAKSDYFHKVEELKDKKSDLSSFEASKK